MHRPGAIAVLAEHALEQEVGEHHRQALPGMHQLPAPLREGRGLVQLTERCKEYGHAGIMFYGPKLEREPYLSSEALGLETV